MGQTQSSTQLATNINFLANTIKNSRETPELAIQEALLRFHNDLLGNSILPDGVSDSFVLAGSLLFTGLLGLLYMAIKGLRRDSNEHRKLLLKLQDKQESLAVSIENKDCLIKIILLKDQLITDLLTVNYYLLGLSPCPQVREGISTFNKCNLTYCVF